MARSEREMTEAVIDDTGAVAVSALAISWGTNGGLHVQQWPVVGRPVALWSSELIDLQTSAREALLGVELGMASNSSVLDVHLNHAPSGPGIWMVATVLGDLIEEITADACAFEPEAASVL